MEGVRPYLALLHSPFIARLWPHFLIRIQLHSLFKLRAEGWGPGPEQRCFHITSNHFLLHRLFSSMPSFLTTDFFSKFLLFSLVLVTSYLCYFCAWNSSLLSHPAIPKHRACSSALSNKTLVCLVTICLLKLTDCYWIPFSSFISLLGNPWISSDFLQIWVFICSILTCSKDSMLNILG